MSNKPRPNASRDDVQEALQSSGIDGNDVEMNPTTASSDGLDAIGAVIGDGGDPVVEMEVENGDDYTDNYDDEALLAQDTATDADPVDINIVLNENIDDECEPCESDEPRRENAVAFSSLRNAHGDDDADAGDNAKSIAVSVSLPAEEPNLDITDDGGGELAGTTDKTIQERLRYLPYREMGQTMKKKTSSAMRKTKSICGMILGRSELTPFQEMLRYGVFLLL